MNASSQVEPNDVIARNDLQPLKTWEKSSETRNQLPQRILLLPTHKNCGQTSYSLVLYPPRPNTRSELITQTSPTSDSALRLTVTITA
jgi:hypothetical protein